MSLNHLRLPCRTLSSGLLLSAVSIACADWTVVKLHPTGGINSTVFSVHGLQQAGQAHINQAMRAVIWSGSANSWVDLHPFSDDFSSSIAATNGVQQGGHARVTVGSQTDDHASLWSGTKESWVDINPAGAYTSQVLAMDDSQQVGIAAFAGFFQASLWSGSAASYINLHPAVATESYAYGVHGGQQVGSVRIGGVRRAALWTGSAGSFVDLSPDGAESLAFAVHNGQQGGSFSDGTKDFAALWSGTAASMVNLNPDGYVASRINAIHNGEQVGRVTFVDVNSQIRRYAAFWRGTPESFENLSDWLPSDLGEASALSITHVGSVAYVGGRAKSSPGAGIDHAIMWVSSEMSAPLSINLLQGILASGGVPQVIQSDNEYYVAKPNYTVPRTTPPLQIEVEGVSSEGNVSILKFRLESAASTTGGSQSISLYNYTTSAYDMLDTRALAATDYKIDVVVTQNASNYVHPTTKAMKAKVSVIPPSNASRSWSFSVDQASWGITAP